MKKLVLKSFIIFLVLLVSCKNDIKTENKVVKNNTPDKIKKNVTTDEKIKVIKKVVQNKIGDTIYGDFNGDGNFENAFRVLTKKGYGNPIEDGVADEYEIHFSDKNINPIPVNCCWFTLINEGDLNNDGSDEISIVQAPENGCNGWVKTFKVDNKKSVFLIKEWVSIFFCGEEFKDDELQKLVVSENGIIYYFENDVNDGKLIKHKATIVKSLSSEGYKVLNETPVNDEVIDNNAINNLNDLLNVSELSLPRMIHILQYTWEIKPPIQDNSEEGFVTERFPFVYNKNNRKQVLKRCVRTNMNTGQKNSLTSFTSNDKELFARIIKNLPYQGFEKKGTVEKSDYIYEDGNRIIMITLSKNYYEINVII